MGRNRVNPGVNDLASKNPQLADDWDYERNNPLRPENVTSSSARKVWWHCALGHNWIESIHNRDHGRGCPICSGRQVLVGFNDLATRNPQLAKEWDHEKNESLKPEDVGPGSHRKVWWKCILGHSWESVVYSRVSGADCPICAGQQVLVGFNDLATKNPKLAAEWDYEKNTPLRPENVTEMSNRKVWWRCAIGHRWNASVNHRAKGTGCPFCSGKKVLVGFNDLTSTNPSLAEEWDYEWNSPLKPENVTQSSFRKVWWRCARGHSWKSSIDIRNSGKGCPICAGKQVLPGFNDLATKIPYLLDEWDYERNSPLTPENVTAFSNKKVWWRCSNGHSWNTTIAERSGGTGCPICAGKQVLVGFNDLLTKNHQLATEWDYEKNASLKPENVTVFSNRMVWWRCKFGHSWKASVSNRSIGRGCPICANREVLEGYNDFASLSPDLLKSWDYERNTFSPYEIPPHSAHKVWWKCDYGHHWRSAVNDRQHGNECPYCAGKMPSRRHLVP